MNNWITCRVIQDEKNQRCYVIHKFNIYWVLSDRHCRVKGKKTAVLSLIFDGVQWGQRELQQREGKWLRRLHRGACCILWETRIGCQGNKKTLNQNRLRWLKTHFINRLSIDKHKHNFPPPPGLNSLVWEHTKNTFVFEKDTERYLS